MNTLLYENITDFSVITKFHYKSIYCLLTMAKTIIINTGCQITRGILNKVAS